MLHSYEYQLQKALLDLPEHIQTAVKEFDWAGEILEIARAHRVQIDDISILQEETMKVIVGLERAANYRSNLIDKMGIDDELAEALVIESNNRIFKELQRRAFSKENHNKVSDELKEEGIHLINESDEEIEQVDTNASIEHNVPSYRESISEDDMVTVPKQHVTANPLTDKKQQTMNSLDQKLFNENHHAKGDTLIIDDSKDENDFFGQLKNT